VQDYTLEFRKARANLSKTREHQELLNRCHRASSFIFPFDLHLLSSSRANSVRRDIRSYKTGTTAPGAPSGSHSIISCFILPAPKPPRLRHHAHCTAQAAAREPTASFESAVHCTRLKEAPTP
jgi:hypothetical protein